ncbi:MAG TPA: glycosyltransferase [Gemmatimonadales bacterium]|nr:glycosyltransferase [Gemmatimonadales bacterium]
MQRVTVVHLVSTLGIGGQEMVIHSLVSHADLRRFRPIVLALHDGGPVADRIASLGVPVEVLGGGEAGTVTLIRRLAARLRTHCPDILHTHNPAPHQLGAVAHVLARVPALIHTKHGRNNFPTRTRRWAEQMAGRVTDLVVPVSEDAAEVARTVDRVPARKIRVIHNGIDLTALGMAEVLPSGRAPRAVHVARLNRVKDQRSLLASTRLLVDRHPGFHLDIVGDGPMGAELRALATALGLDSAVTFHGMQDDVTPYLANADLFLLPSLSEGIAITMLEAMGSGLPVVATDVGGNREVVVQGETGLLVPAGDPTSLADAVDQLLADPARARSWGAAGRQRVETDFNIAGTVRAYEAAYLEVLGRPVVAPVAVPA